MTNDMIDIMIQIAKAIGGTGLVLGMWFVYRASKTADEAVELLRSININTVNNGERIKNSFDEIFRQLHEHDGLQTDIGHDIIRIQSTLDGFLRHQ